MIKNFVFLSALIALIFLPLNAFAHTDVTVPDANAMIQSNGDLIVIDVRENQEYCGSLGHIAGALLYPWNSNFLQTHYTELPVDANILVVCGSGGRSNSAANFLDSKGYLHIYDMLGGTGAWVNTWHYKLSAVLIQTATASITTSIFVPMFIILLKQIPIAMVSETPAIVTAPISTLLIR